MAKKFELFKESNPSFKLTISTDDNGVITNIDNGTDREQPFNVGQQGENRINTWALHNGWEVLETTETKSYCVEFKKPRTTGEQMLLNKIRIKLESTQFNIRPSIIIKENVVQYRFKSIPEYNTAVKLMESLKADKLVLREGLTITKTKKENKPTTNWIYPSLEQNSEILLDIIIQVIKRDAESFEGFIGSELPVEITKKMVNKGISYMEGDCTEDEYISALDNELKKLSRGKIKLTDFAKKHIRSRMKLFYTPSDKIKLV